MTLMCFHRNADGVKNVVEVSSLRVCITTKDTENLLEKLSVLYLLFQRNYQYTQIRRYSWVKTKHLRH